VEAFKHWRHYFEGAAHAIEVLTDHNNLRGFMKVKTLNGRQARWATLLATFDFEIKHRSGKTNPADAPSRRPDYEPSESPIDTQLLPSLQAKLAVWGDSLPDRITVGRIRASATQMATDIPIRSVKYQEMASTARIAAFNMPRVGTAGVTHAERPYAEFPSELMLQFIGTLQKADPALQPEAKSYTRLKNQLQNNNGLLYKGEALYIPQDHTLRNELLRIYHDDPLAGHFGVDKTIALLTRKYFWPNMDQEVTQYVKSCAICQKIKARRHKPYGEMQALPRPLQPMTEITMDFITDLPPSMLDACVYDSILVIVDRCTRWAMYIPVNKTITASELAQVFYSKWVAMYGLPDGIVSDRGSVFTSDYWSALAFETQITRRLSTAFHPQTDGQTERQNQVLEAYLRCYCSTKQDEWAKWLPFAAFASNNSTSQSLSDSPNNVLMGFHPRIRPIGPRDENPGKEVPGAEERAKHLFDLRKELADSWLHASQQQAKYYNKGRKPMSFKVGDNVLLSLKNIKIHLPSRKMTQKFDGPFRVMGIVGKQAYRLALPKQYSRLHNVFYVSLLEPWNERDSGGQRANPANPVPLQLDENAALEYEVESIVHARTRKGEREYLVK